MHGLAAEAVTQGPGFAAFRDPMLWLQYGLILVEATLSAMALAYHPIYRGRPKTMEDLELNKTLIIYSVAGAVIAIICNAAPSMAFVIFGIGGLMRFRTNLDSSKSTGHAIIGTLIGICWGLGLELVAVLATVFFWAMIFFLEHAVVVELIVGGVKVSAMSPSADAYREAIGRAGCRLSAHHKNFKKGEMAFVFKLPRAIPIEKVIGEVDKISEDLRGTPDWPS
jgi:hypothetical protein